MTLNDEQLAVIRSEAKIRLVVAGPGSGKTRTLVNAVWEVEEHANVVVLTFTNAGANEFKRRLSEMGDTRKIVYCGNIHGYCMRLIQQFGALLGYVEGSVGILPEDEKEKMIKALAKKYKRDEEDWIVQREFEFELKRSNMVDFDGILRDGLAIIKLATDYSQAYRLVRPDYLFVDEWQDSSKIDWEIYNAIAAFRKFLVGDPDQCVYMFRGAHPEGRNELPNPTVFTLERNYRSTHRICAAAASLINHNPRSLTKDLIPDSTHEGEPIQISKFPDAGAELAALGRWIMEYQVVSENNTIAVLYRNQNEVTQCRKYLDGLGVRVARPKYESIPQNWDRTKSLVQMLINPHNAIVLKRLGSINAVPPEAGICRFLAENGVCESTRVFISERMSVIGSSDPRDLLADLYSYRGEGDGNASCDANEVYVGTMHSAKGMEFDIVYLPAFEQGIIPHVKTTVEIEPGKSVGLAELEQERRLAFVAVTRARKELWISSTSHRISQWHQPVGGSPSQFIKEMGL